MSSGLELDDITGQELDNITGQEFYYVIVAVNIELQNLLSLLLSIYADEHALINPPDQGTNALYKLLSTYIGPLKEKIRPYVWRHLFMSDAREAILPLVDARKLDSSLLFSIFKVKEILKKSDYTFEKCTNSYCNGPSCCAGCNHISPGCKNCNGKDCSKITNNRLHLCQSCKRNVQECKEHKMICCTSCKTCIRCNKKKFEHDALDSSSTPTLTCSWFTFVHSLDMAKCFRDLYGHVTVDECEAFTENNVALNKEFKNYTKPKELERYLQFLFEQIVDHSTKLQNGITNASMVPSPNSTIPSPNSTMERLGKIMDNLESIFKHGKSLIDHIASPDNLLKMQQMNDERFHEKVGHMWEDLLTASKSKEKQDDRHQVQLVRRINTGFVLKLPLAEDDVVKVEYKRDGDECWTEANADQKRDDGAVYLRVEGLQTGNFNVRLTLTFEGVSKVFRRSVPVLASVQWIMKTDDLTITAPPNRSDGDIFSFLTSHNNNCIQKTSILAIIHKGYNDDKCNDGGNSNLDESEEETDVSDEETDVSDEETDVSDDESTEFLEVEKFSEKCLRDLESKFEKFEDVITFPPLNMIMDDLMREISEAFADLLKQESKPGLRLIVSNYDDAKFSKFITHLEASAFFDGVHPATNRLLLFYSAFATIVNIRIVKDKANIHKEMTNCINDIKLFSCTFKSFINSSVIVTGLLVCPHMSRTEVVWEMEFYFKSGRKSKRLMKYFFLTKDEWESNMDKSNEKERKLTKWWKNNFQRRLLKVSNSIISSIDSNISLKMFKRISGQCIATIEC